MKKKSALVIALIALTFAVVFFLQRSLVIQDAKGFAETNSAPASLINASTTNSALTTTSSVTPALKSNLVQNDREKPEAFQQTIEQKNSPINFYGKVVDQDGNPVSGVTVNVKVRQWYVRSLATFDTDAHIIPIKKETDLSGRLEIHGMEGDVFDVESIQKPGYVLSPKTPNGFGPSSGSLENPVIIKMWKMGEKAQLVDGSKFWGIIPDGRIYTLDLIQGTKVESATAVGDLRVIVNRPSGVSRQDRYDWSFQITPIDGGIIETEDEFMYQAPQDGYTPEYKLQLAASDTKWTYRVKKSFFVKTRGGQNYGRINVEVFAHYQNDGVFSVDYAVNPHGSRNLQP